MELRNQRIARIVYAVLDVPAHFGLGKLSAVRKANDFVIVESGIEQVDTAEKGLRAVFVDMTVAFGLL